MAYKLFALRYTIIVRTAVTAMLLLLSCFVIAQSKVRGIVVNNNGDPLVNASVMLLNFNDSSLIKGSMIIKEGKHRAVATKAFTGGSQLIKRYCYGQETID